MTVAFLLGFKSNVYSQCNSVTITNESLTNNNGNFDINFTFQFGSGNPSFHVIYSCNGGASTTTTCYSKNTYGGTATNITIPTNCPYSNVILATIQGFTNPNCGGTQCHPSNVFDGTPLPVNLLYYRATKEDSENTLTWATTAEENNDYFTLEKSYDMLSWVWVDTVKGAGNSFESNYYSYKDYDNSDVVFYRLSQTDYDGTHEELGIRKVLASTPDLEKIKWFPNPATDFLMVEGLFVSLNYECYNSIGQKILTGVVDYGEEVDVSELIKGTYYIIFTKEEKIVNKGVFIKE